ncbi:MAG TPA: VOC family protein [Syntrophorhabdales bacterium]|nr:VOC family protein [Syntrophorhabdales bacterium]
MFSGFEHTAIAAHDSKTLADWYIRMFGLQVVHDNGKTPPTYLLRAPDGTVIEILPAFSGEKIDYLQTHAGLRHLALTVSDFDAALNYLRERGIDQFFDLRQSEESKLIFFRDPEGNILHLLWRAKPLGSSKK